jgi:hypothetical protein
LCCLPQLYVFVLPVEMDILVVTVTVAAIKLLLGLLVTGVQVNSWPLLPSVTVALPVHTLTVTVLPSPVLKLVPVTVNKFTGVIGQLTRLPVTVEQSEFDILVTVGTSIYVTVTLLLLIALPPSCCTFTVTDVPALSGFIRQTILVSVITGWGIAPPLVSHILVLVMILLLSGTKLLPCIVIVPPIGQLVNE